MGQDMMGIFVVGRDACQCIMIISWLDVVMTCLKANLQGKIGQFD